MYLRPRNHHALSRQSSSVAQILCAFRHSTSRLALDLFKAIIPSRKIDVVYVPPCDPVNRVLSTQSRHRMQQLVTTLRDTLATTAS